MNGPSSLSSMASSQPLVYIGVVRLMEGACPPEAFGRSGVGLPPVVNATTKPCAR